MKLKNSPVKRFQVKTYHTKAPAKINIGLRVLSKRKDGFHNIETIFYPVKIFDDITIKIQKLPKGSVNNIINVTTNSLNNISGKNNICYKAAELFLQEFGIKTNYKVDIKIKKNIPMGAGLGGGSSDAASVLKILYIHCHPELVSGSKNKMLKQVQQDKLLKIAMVSGSDVPFFLLSKPAYATGRGEKLTLLPNFKVKYKILIVNPGIHVSTPQAYKALSIKTIKKPVLSKISKFDSANKLLMINDFERVVFKKNPEIEKIKYDMIMLGAEFSLMSGSGSTVYGLFKGIPDEAKKFFMKKKYKVFIV